MGRKKPSMFSRNYAEEMKKRKRRKYIILVLACAFLAGTTLIFSTSLKDKIVNVIKFQNKDNKEETQIDTNESIKEETKKEENTEQKAKEEVIQTKDVDIEGKKVKLTLDKSGQGIKNLETDNTLVWDISPNEKKAVVLNNESQSVYLVDATGNVLDITQKEYISTENQSYPKEQVLANNPGYIWVSTPKFISDKNIVYISYLPWITSEKNQYLWTYDIQSAERVPHYEIYGKNIIMGKIEEKGLAVKVDNNEVFINSQGNIVY